MSFSEGVRGNADAEGLPPGQTTILDAPHVLSARGADRISITGGWGKRMGLFVERFGTRLYCRPQFYAPDT
jgi:hypothetical protein